MSKHTPGPWKVVAVDWSPEGNARFEIEGVYRTGMADARLIAAAPELLAALKAIHNHRPLGEGSSEYSLAVESIARAAIAKATGDQA